MTDKLIITAWLGKEIDPLDPRAWPEILEAIERSGDVAVLFTANLKRATIGSDIASLTSRHCMKLLKSTEAQKARALARAIKEVGR